MTDRSNDAPGDDLVPTPDEAVEESADLTDAEIAAASDAAAGEVGEAEAGGETLEQAEAYDAEEVFEGEDTDEGDEEPAPQQPGRRLTAAEAAARRSAGGRGRDARAPKPTRTAFPIDPALRIKDPASAAFVVASIVVFLLIFLNAMAFGRGGAFTPVPTATPFVSASPAPSASPGASGSAAPSAAATSAPSVAPTTAPSAASSAAPATTAPSPAGT